MRLVSSFLIFLTVCFILPTSASAALREIKIHAAVSESFKFDPDWDRDIRDRILFVNKIFEPLFDIHFSVEKFIPWDISDETRETDLLMEELKSFIPQGKDHVIVGFHKMSQPFSKGKVLDLDRIGSAQFFRGFVVIRDPFGPFATTQKEIVLAHEFAHLFGAVHVADKSAIMNAVLAINPSLQLDEDNRKIINATRNVDFRKGLDSLGDDVIDQLIKVYEKLIRDHPHSDFYLQLGKFYERRQQIARAVSTWEEAVRYHYDNPAIHRELGFQYYAAGRYTQAIRELGSAVAHFILPSQKKARAQVLNFLGVAYYNKGNLQQAIVTWLRALGDDPDDHVIQSNLAMAYMESGDIDRAISELKKIIVKGKKDPTVLSNLGVALMRKKEFVEAEGYLEKALEESRIRKNANARSLMRDGKLADIMGDIPEGMILLNLGSVRLQLGKPEKALYVFEDAKRLDTDSFEVHRNLAQTYIDLEQYQKALGAIETALKHKKDDPYLYALKAQASSVVGNDQDVIEAAKAGLKYAEGDLAANFHKNLSLLYAKQGRYAEAMEEIRVSLNENWNDADSHFYLGNLYARKGEFNHAKRSFQAALRVNPDHQLAKKALSDIAKHIAATR